MQEVGEIMHLAGSGRVIIQLSKELVEGQILCDDKGTRVAKVMELIGPIKKPFASAMPLTNNINKFIGKRVFMFEQSSANKPKKFRRNRR
ncbi:MAG: Gar1/Naf1 family protein [Crenarchaeota archaeon]|nr:Gar1/Naf1 family protein [Thermoproteota archaeon]HJJ21712.1 Gar1/Naf1 family protein [Nitrosopumilus sp.]MDA0853800.1 Gar1/Naf1 family protein [Thermoproteota archaeon]MDA1123453.1 Gar1/Naf1 family protein [Thermoproteota archaeon]HJJ24281.1 Gar1/Naf1 family protein [Nitrosopumilus sp.]